MAASISTPTLFAGIVTSNTYNKRLQPALLSAASPAQGVFSLTYNFSLGSDNGNVAQIVNNLDSTRSVAFTYDPLNRIAQAYTLNTTSGNCWGETFATTPTAPGVLPSPSNAGIDAWGNLTNRSGVSGMGSNCYTEGLNASAFANNHLSGLTYDRAGNVTIDSSGNSMTYDAENTLGKFGTVTYDYDADGVRTEKSTGTMYWLGPSGTLAETDLSGNINEEYIYFNGQRIARVDRPSGTVHYYYSNHLGSHTVITSATGTCEQDIDYFPYGGIVNDYCPNVAQHYKFTGKERDTESSLDYSGARYYASSMGRFMSPDPEQIDGFDHMSNPQAWNGYAYVHNNPLNATDPDGEKYQVCDENGQNCSNQSDTDFAQNQQNAQSAGEVWKNGQIYAPDADGNLQFKGTYNQTDVDLNPTAQVILSQPVINNAAGAGNFLFNTEKNAIGYFFPITNLIVNKIAGAGSTGTDAAKAGISSKPGSLGQFKGTDALRRENKVARDIMKELNLGEDAKAAVHEALSEGAQMAGRKLTYQQGVAAVKAALGLR